jgi:hypothetical protein
LQKLIPEEYSCGSTVSAIIELIESTFQSYIQKEDITML